VVDVYVNVISGPNKIYGWSSIVTRSAQSSAGSEVRGGEDSGEGFPVTKGTRQTVEPNPSLLT